MASASVGAWRAAAAIACGLAAAWVSTYLAGGTHTVMPHFFYLPVIVAASRFREKGALAVALTAGLLVGPLMPLDVAAATAQQTLGWLIRMGFFVLCGQTVALLCHRSLSGLASAVADIRTRAELEGALDRAEFGVVYQPLIDLRTHAIIGVEALVRWHHPARGTVAPDQFIDAAERTGAILPLGMWVLRQAVTQAARWQQRAGASQLKVAVNISARQLDDDNLVRDVARVLSETGFPPAALQLEVTETAVIADFAEATKRIDELRALGVAIAIDDFGTGHSSLAYLHRFDADVIKIDRSFVDALESDGHARTVAEGVVRLATSLGVITVAEGIEKQQQADILRALGCDLGQGYYYARPGDCARIDALLDSALVAA